MTDGEFGSFAQWLQRAFGEHICPWCDMSWQGTVIDGWLCCEHCHETFHRVLQ